MTVMDRRVDSGMCGHKHSFSFLAPTTFERFFGTEWTHEASYWGRHSEVCTYIEKIPRR
jgi:hypothetical protein